MFYYPVMIVRHVFVDDAYKSANKEFFFSILFFLFLTRKTCWSLKKQKSLAIYLLS